MLYIWLENICVVIYIFICVSINNLMLIKSLKNCLLVPLLAYSFSILESHVLDPVPETGGRGMDQVLGSKYAKYH